MGSQTFTESGDFTGPAGVLILTLVDGWGGSAGGNLVNLAQVGGGGGGQHQRLVNFVITDQQVIPVVIGAGGSVGNAGGDTTFNGTSLVAKGGKAGNGTIGGAGGGVDGAGTGDITHNGGDGGSSSGRGVAFGGGGGGSGGTSSAGNNGTGGATGGAGAVAVTGGGAGGAGADQSGLIAASAGSVPGGGGGGGTQSPSLASGVGARGQLTIYWEDPVTGPPLGTRSLLGVGK